MTKKALSYYKLSPYSPKRTMRKPHIPGQELGWEEARRKSTGFALEHWRVKRETLSFAVKEAQGSIRSSKKTHRIAGSHAALNSLSI